MKIGTFFILLVLTSINSCKKSDTSSDSIPLNLKIGQSFQGGLVAYIDPTGQHGLIISNELAGSYSWLNSNIFKGSITGATGTAIGTGASNTKIIVSHKADTGYNAADICNNYVSNGYDDWYLPSRDELKQIYIHKFDLACPLAAFWSSSETDSVRAEYMDFSNGSQYGRLKGYKFEVLPVRSF